ncbi:hypothetical protein V5799_016874 [Amblyomma americanum]|uniref:Uncharacterized protein n=1 Tax=Amblyomma americanum TaxID=6943 RepID=A0AAQ4F4Y7_AMBAM
MATRTRPYLVRFNLAVGVSSGRNEWKKWQRERLEALASKKAPIFRVPCRYPREFPALTDFPAFRKLHEDYYRRVRRTRSQNPDSFFVFLEISAPLPAGHVLREDGGESEGLPPPGREPKSPRGVDAVVSSQLHLEAYQKSPLTKYRHVLAAIEMSGHTTILIGGLTTLMWLFACDVPVRTFFLNVLLAVMVDAMLMAMLKAAATWLDCDQQQVSAPGFSSKLASRAVLVTLLVVNHTRSFRLLKATLVTWCIGVGLTKALQGKEYLGDFLMGAMLGYLEYHLVVEPIWCSEEVVSTLFKTFFCLGEQARDLVLW